MFSQPLPDAAGAPRAPGLFTRLMPRRLTLALAAGAVALTGFAGAPARAGSDDVVRFLMGAAAVAVIISAINDNDRPEFISARTLPRQCRTEIRLDGRRAELYGSSCLQRAGYRNLPRRCEVRVHTARGELRGYEASCLASQGYGFASAGRPAPMPYFSPAPRHENWRGHDRDRWESHDRGRDRARDRDRDRDRDRGRDRWEDRDRRGTHDRLRGRDDFIDRRVPRREDPQHDRGQGWR